MADSQPVSFCKTCLRPFKRTRKQNAYWHAEPFLKLAQLSAWILHIEGAVRWPDVERLTAFADYIVPAGLRAMGVLRYSDELDRAMGRGEQIEAGSAREIELRAHSINACSILRELVNG